MSASFPCIHTNVHFVNYKVVHVSDLQAHLKKGFTQWVVTRIYTQWFSTYGTRVAFGFLSEVWCRINLWSLLLHLSPLTSLFARLNHPRQACGEKKTVAALALIIFS